MKFTNGHTSIDKIECYFKFGELSLKNYKDNKKTIW